MFFFFVKTSLKNVFVVKTSLKESYVKRQGICNWMLAHKLKLRKFRRAAASGKRKCYPVDRFRVRKYVDTIRHRF